jgi:hypothetical protein
MNATAAERRAQAKAAIAAALDDLRSAWRALDAANRDLRDPRTPDFRKRTLLLPPPPTALHLKPSPLPLTIFSRNFDAPS